MTAAGDARGADDDGARDTPAPDLVESLRQLASTGRGVWGAGNDALKALRVLFKADVSLARSAFGRTLALTAVAISFGASAWLLLMATVVAWLSLDFGLSWPLSLLLTGVGSLVLAGLGGWLALRYFEHTRFKATRRQLARLGVGELASLMPDAGSRASTEAVAERVADHVADTGEGEPAKKGLGVDITPP